MNENISEDFGIFATSKRIKKEEPNPIKSPLDASSKWGMQNEFHSEKPVENHKTLNLANNPEIIVQNISTQIHDVEDPIGNIGTELQKFRKYPQKKYDTYINKMVLFNEEEFFLIRDLSSEISIARKRSSIPNKGSLPRITENTVVRAALKAVFQKIGKTNLNVLNLQTEEDLENYFSSLLK